MSQQDMTMANKETAEQVRGGRTRCEVWTRVMGYHRPVSHFNIGKKAEYYSRKHFEECVADNKRFMSQYPLSKPV